MMEVILTADAGADIDRARMTWMTRTAVVAEAVTIPSAAGRRRGIAMPPKRGDDGTRELKTLYEETELIGSGRRVEIGAKLGSVRNEQDG